jgi:Skp family chaperone for outer membrane proteins
MPLLNTRRRIPETGHTPRCFLRFGVLLIALTSTAAGAQRATNRAPLTPRIAFVDVQQLLDSVPGRSAVAAGFADEVRLAETRVRLAADSLQRAVESFAQRQQDLTPTQREAATLTLRARELQLEDMVQRLNISVMERRDALQAPLAACVQRAMRVVQERDGWHGIVDRDVLGPVVVLSADVDITRQVLEVLRRLGTEPCQVR